MYANAEEALKTLAAGKPLCSSLAVAGALELEHLAKLPGASVDLQDAFYGLQLIAAGGDLELNGEGRARAGRLAVLLSALRRSPVTSRGRTVAR
jgi:hypothetical protein